MLTSFIFGAVLAVAGHGITVDAALDRAAAHAGAPVGLALQFEIADDVPELCLISLYHSYVRIGIQDSSGNVIFEITPGPKRCGRVFDPYWSFRFKSSDKVRQTACRLVLNEWLSTGLPPANYLVTVDIEHIGVLWAPGNTNSSGRAYAAAEELYPMKKHWELPLEILGEDDEAVRREYAELLRTIRDRSTENMEHGKRALELLVYAKEPLALPYQLQLYLEDESTLRRYADFENCFDYDLPMRFIESNSAEAAAALVEYLKPMEKTKDEMNALVRYDQRVQIVLWTIFELHDKGNPAVTAITAPVVERHERPSDPRPVPGMD